MGGKAPEGCPSSAVDLWSDEALSDPYPFFASLRQAGPVVWLERQALAALPRFEQVSAVLADWQRFSSARGVAVDEQANAMMGESMICSDPPLHDTYRKPVADQMTVGALAELAPAVRDTAERLADKVTAAGTFDAVTDLARPYSLTVVADLVGLPPEGRDVYPPLAERAFNIFGPASGRAHDGMAAVGELIQRAMTAQEPGGLVPGRWGDQLARQEMALSLVAYTWPGIDTTVNALSSAIALFARHPDQWEAVRADRSLVPAAFNEVLRLHAPVQFFTRWATEDVEVAGVALAQGTRVLVMYGSANRDEHRYPDPDRFDVRRDPAAHVSFGRGVHLCAGIHLARLEAHSLLSALADRVERFEPAGEHRWMVNNTLHGLSSAPVRVIGGSPT